MSEPDSEFIEIFRDEARGRLDRIVDTLLALESGSAAPDAVDALFRDVHTIKGAAGMVGLADVSALAHVMEDLLADARHDGALAADHIDPLLRSSDALRRHVAGEGEPNLELIAELVAAKVPANGTPVEPHQSAPAAAAPAPAAESRSIRVPAEKIDTLLDLVGETVLHRRRLEHELGANGHAGHGVVTDELDRGERLLDDLKGAAIGMRTLPLSSIVTPLPRAVRDLAGETGKQVELVVVGAETELDRAILEGLSEPLVHLLRNAVGHGIEPPDERERAGKPARGRLELRAEQRGSIVEVTVSDDGRGISEETLAEARRSGLAHRRPHPARLLDRERRQRARRARRRARRRPGPGRGVRWQHRGAQRARARHAGDPAAAARARADRGAARRARRQRLRIPARERRGGRLARRDAVARRAAGDRAARPLRRARRSRGADGRRPRSAGAARTRGRAGRVGPAGRPDLRRAARQGGGRGQVARPAARPAVDVPGRRDPRRRPHRPARRPGRARCARPRNRARPRRRSPPPGRARRRCSSSRTR